MRSREAGSAPTQARKWGQTGDASGKQTQSGWSRLPGSLSPPANLSLVVRGKRLVLLAYARFWHPFRIQDASLVNPEHPLIELAKSDLSGFARGDQPQ
jgi:hypothetical protein